MISHGDELGRTQQGNNNAYCQDNELTWIDWSNVDEETVDFTANVSQLRSEHPVFHRRRFFDGKPVPGDKGKEGRDIAWLTPAGAEMTAEDWGSGFGKAIMVFVNGHGIPDTDRRGRRVLDSSFLLCFNGHDGDLDFTLPDEDYEVAWRTIVDTATGQSTPSEDLVPAAERIVVPSRSMIVMQEAVHSGE